MKQLIANQKVSRRKIVLSLLMITSLTGCLPIQAYFYWLPDEKDLHRFKHEEVKHAEICFDFKELLINRPIQVTNWTYKEPLTRLSLEEFLKQQKANHFLVIKNDSIVFEYNNEKITDYEPSPIFSVAKTFVSSALGVALQEGYIGSINDLVKDYLPELNYHEYFDYLTINHLLNQTSGLRMEVDNISNAHYGKVEKVLKGLHFKAKPGEHLEYINICTVLVGIIIERTTGRNLHEYFSEKIWSKIGTCDSTVWGYDYKTEHTRSFCCIGGSARDFAKFGRLYLNNGRWEGQQVIDSNWVISSTSPINALGENVGYNNNWFIGDKDIGDFMSRGMFRQQIYINPKENVIIVSLMKFHKKNLALSWWELLRQISNSC